MSVKFQATNFLVHQFIQQIQYTAEKKFKLKYKSIIIAVKTGNFLPCFQEVIAFNTHNAPV